MAWSTNKYISLSSLSDFEFGIGLKLPPTIPRALISFEWKANFPTSLILPNKRNGVSSQMQSQAGAGRSPIVPGTAHQLKTPSDFRQRAHGVESTD